MASVNLRLGADDPPNPAVQHRRDALRPREIALRDRSPEHGPRIVSGQLSGPQQPLQGPPLRVSRVPRPVICRHQRSDYLLTAANTSRAGDISPHRRQRGEARDPIEFSPHRLGRRPFGLLPPQYCGQHRQPARPDLLLRSRVLEVRRRTQVRRDVCGPRVLRYHVGGIPLATAESPRQPGHRPRLVSSSTRRAVRASGSSPTTARCHAGSSSGPALPRTACATATRRG